MNTNAMKTKQKKRLGTVTLKISYIVDLDNPSMVDHAKESIREDIEEALTRNNLDNHIEITHDGTLQESQIPAFLLPADDLLDRARDVLKKLLSELE
jgi:hypothetical protein